MKKILGLAVLVGVIIKTISILVLSVSAQTQSSLYIAYPPENHQTTAAKIFLIGTAPSSGEVFVNDQPIDRSEAGHFAPSFPLQVGENLFKLRYQEQEIALKVIRNSTQPEIPAKVSFAKDSLTPATDIARLPDELICFGAVAPPNANVSVSLGDRTIPLESQWRSVQLPPNSAILTSENQPISSSKIGKYEACTAISKPGSLGNPIFQLSLDGQTIKQPSTGKIEILSPTQLEVIEVTAPVGVARTGPSSDYSRLTPLPKGTKALVTAKEGDWLGLDYGGWIRRSETELLPTHIPPRSIIRSITSRQVDGATEIIFPLQTPIPVSVQQGERTFTLTLYNTTAQTDTIRLNDDPLIKRLDWQQVTPTQIEYIFTLKSEQQWGYNLKYEDSSLILSLRHPPSAMGGKSRRKDLSGVKILLDPGHGGQELGSKGPTGYPEKDANLVVSKLLQQELVQRGAIVYLTRETDKDVSLPERTETIEQIKPAIALSLHYNALPDSGDAINTSGVSTFWYHPQAHDLAVFLHNYLVKALNRPSYGIFWNNLALTRPQIAPSVLLELGFMINPEEFEWIVNSQEQKKLAETLADGISEWLATVK
jgi:N-acetylmuramoyl-L-alanine amidase